MPQSLETERRADRSFLLAFGVHLNVLCIIAQLLLIREKLMETHS